MYNPMTHGNKQEGMEVIMEIWTNMKPTLEPTAEEVRTMVEEEVKEVFWNGLERYKNDQLTFI